MDVGDSPFQATSPTFSTPDRVTQVTDIWPYSFYHLIPACREKGKTQVTSVTSSTGPIHRVTPVGIRIQT